MTARRRERKRRGEEDRRGRGEEKRGIGRGAKSGKWIKLVKYVVPKNVSPFLFIPKLSSHFFDRLLYVN